MSAKNRLTRKSQKSFFAPDTQRKSSCQACGQEHWIDAGTWVILASGALVCSNDKCWRILANWYKEKEDAKKVDESTAGSTLSQD